MRKNKDVWFTIEVKSWWFTIIVLTILLIIVTRWKTMNLPKGAIPLG